MKTKWTHELLEKEANKYSSVIGFREGSNSAYVTAKNRGILDNVCGHMKRNTRWTFDMLKSEALKYNTRSEFQYVCSSAYLTARRRGILEEICGHMPIHVNQSGEGNSRFKWTVDLLQAEALKYTTRADFKKHSSGAYAAILRNGLLEQTCGHMKISHSVSVAEIIILDEMRSAYPSTRSLRDRRVYIEGKPHVKGFEIDIYVPELRKGIEFDGKYYHSFSGLKRSRRNWPDEDILNYHKLKDDYFKSKGIEILHIKEEEWLKNKEKCIKRCLSFLDGK